MIYPIVIYGDPILKQKALDIPDNSDGLQKLIQDMFLTMDNAMGIGLAAPQIGKSIRLFIVDASPLAEDYPDEKLDTFKKVFINAYITEENNNPFKFDEGCLSIPGIRETVIRPDTITLSYLDENFNPHKETFTGIKARIIQHEYDHIEGVLFIDRLSPLKKSILKSKLLNMKSGKVSAKYPVKIYKPKK